jgi:hypothetical protein
MQVRGYSWLAIAQDCYEKGELEGELEGDCHLPCELSEVTLPPAQRAFIGEVGEVGGGGGGGGGGACPLITAPPSLCADGAIPALATTLMTNPALVTNPTLVTNPARMTNPALVTKLVTEGKQLFGDSARDPAALREALRLFRQAARCCEPVAACLADAVRSPRRSSEQMPDLREIKLAASAFSCVAAALEQSAVLSTRPLSVRAIREALRMRLRAKILYDDAVDFGDLWEISRYSELREGTGAQSQHAADQRLSALCEREEVRDWLHGLLVLRMERMHKGRPDLVEPEMDVPPGWA